jgi:hypothetical protein
MSRQLPVQLDGETLADLALTTWMTDAGPFDVLDGLEDRSGRVVPYEELAKRGNVLYVGGIAVRAAALEVTGPEGPADRRYGESTSAPSCHEGQAGHQVGPCPDASPGEVSSQPCFPLSLPGSSG